MKSLKELQTIAEVIIKNKLPREVTIFLNFKDRIETDSFLKNLGSSGAFNFRYPNTELECDILQYMNIKFYLIDTEYIDEKDAYNPKRSLIEDGDLVVLSHDDTNNTYYVKELIDERGAQSFNLKEIASQNEMQLKIFKNATK